jgi:hypothetical protein
LVFVTLLAYALANNPKLQQQLIDTVIAHFLGFGPQLQESIKTIQGSGIGLVVGVLGTLWGGLGITQSAQDAMNAVWNIPARTVRPGGCGWPAAWARCCWLSRCSPRPRWPNSASPAVAYSAGCPWLARCCSTCCCWPPSPRS